MSEIRKWFNDKQGEIAVEALKKNRFKAEYLANKEEVLQRLLELIPPKASVGIGGSVTLQELGLADQLKERGNFLIDHSDPSLSPEEKLDRRRQQLTADVFLSGSNAVTLDGKLVNEDGHGNRVAGMIFGPRQIIIVAGINKIVRDVDSALERIELVAAPRNNRRLNYANPCVKTGVCSDCNSEQRICNVITIMRKKPTFSDITVLIVGEELGL